MYLKYKIVLPLIDISIKLVIYQNISFLTESEPMNRSKTNSFGNFKPKPVPDGAQQKS